MKRYKYQHNNVEYFISGVPAIFCVRGGGTGRLDLWSSVNGGWRSCFSYPEIDGDAPLESAKRIILGKIFPNGFRHAFFQQLRDNFTRSSIMLTKYPSGESSSCQKGPKLVSKENGVIYSHPQFCTSQIRLWCHDPMNKTSNHPIQWW